MIQAIPLLTGGLALIMLFGRYRREARAGTRRSAGNWIMTAKVLLFALLTWLTVSSTLRHMAGASDEPNPAPSITDRIVSFLKK